VFLSRAAAALLIPLEVPPGVLPSRDALWEHARNSLGIARLLVQEGRPEALVATACLSAVESAIRAALEHAGAPYDGDPAHGADSLSVPEALLPEVGSARGAGRLAATERAVAWVAGYLRAEAPERSWGF
jgi:hypothetical protein